MVNLAEALDHNAGRRRAGPKELSHIEITHHFVGDGHMPETHTFGRTEGHLAIAHIKSVVKLGPASGQSEPEEEKGEEEGESHANPAAE